MDEDFIDLTSPQATRGVNDSPVVVLDDNETEGSGRQSRGRRGRQRQSRTSGTTSSTPANANDSVVILPDLDLSQDTDTASTSDPTSPGLRKIVCPICLDDEKQIQRSGRQLASTICGHVFCQQCITSAVSSLHCCPTCRKKLNKGKVFPLYI
ncbi:hypothetical protein FSP39_004035 [Pinctada imbricata]|uniref:RING-type domain-containing protein n=1 Tax=Pinctada imbricata TaxID=66713 RepID=A0AA88YDP4_PINIB|nr:hypothetical protein FSP39_004035 [Pinctada imbricata]